MKPDLLKGRISAFHLTNEKVGNLIGKSESYVRNCLKTPSKFTMHEVYTICDALEIDQSDIPEIFPRRKNL